MRLVVDVDAVHVLWRVHGSQQPLHLRQRTRRGFKGVYSHVMVCKLTTLYGPTAKISFNEPIICFMLSVKCFDSC